jgi:uncharacterized membrane protein
MADSPIKGHDLYQKLTINARRNAMKKKLMMLAAMVAMTLVAAIPALALEIDQENEQETESGDVDQTFEVSNTGDNSNQCAGIQGVANTGSTQNQIDVTQADDFDEDDLFFFDDDRRHDRDRDRDGDTEFEFDEVSSTIEVSPENSTSCDQQVNQAASATGS